MPLSINRIRDIVTSHTSPFPRVQQRLIRSFTEKVIQYWVDRCKSVGLDESNISTKSNEEIATLLQLPWPENVSRYFCFRFKSDQELYSDFRQQNVSIEEFYEKSYLPYVPEGEVPLRVGSLEAIFAEIARADRRANEVPTRRPVKKDVPVLDLSRQMIESEDLNRDLVRITLSSGGALEFHSNATTPDYICSLLPVLRGLS